MAMTEIDKFFEAIKTCDAWWSEDQLLENVHNIGQGVFEFDGELDPDFFAPEVIAQMRMTYASLQADDVLWLPDGIRDDDIPVVGSDGMSGVPNGVGSVWFGTSEPLSLIGLPMFIRGFSWLMFPSEHLGDYALASFVFTDPIDSSGNVSEPMGVESGICQVVPHDISPHIRIQVPSVVQFPEIGTFANEFDSGLSQGHRTDEWDQDDPFSCLLQAALRDQSARALSFRAA